MTDNFKFIYKILHTLEAAMDYSEFDISQISAERLGISQERWARYIEMMTDVGYIKGISAYKDTIGNIAIEDNGIRITLKGLEYLSENSIMQRFYKTAKGVVDIIP